MRKYDRVGGLIWFLLGAGLCIGSIKLKLGDFHRPGPGFMPFISGTFLLLLGLILTFSAVAKETAGKDELGGRELWTKKNWKNIFFTLLVLFSYLLLFNLLGFILSTFLFFFFLFKLNAPKKWLMPLAFSGIAVFLSHLIFSAWLGCPFPRGILNF
jgi:putative tricarboxylic transport membrane protein